MKRQSILALAVMVTMLVAQAASAGVLYDIQRLEPLAGGDCSWAQAINENGIAVGRSTIQNDECRAVLWENGLTQFLPSLAGGSSRANAINDAGR